MKKNIYISYSWDDKGNIEKVEYIVKCLRDTLKCEYNIILDQEIFNKETQDVNRFIADNIIDADMVIVFVTPSYVIKANKKDDGYGNKKDQKSGVEIETGYILERKHNWEKSIITVLLDGENVPKYLRQLSYIKEEVDSNIIQTLERKIKNFISEKDIHCTYENKKNNENLQTPHNLNLKNKPLDKIVDIEFICTGEPVRISGILLLDKSYVNLEHYQIINIFKKIVSENIMNYFAEKNSFVFQCNYFRIEFKNYDSYKKFIMKIENAMDGYLEAVSNFEVKYEIYSRFPMDNNYDFKLATVNKNIWIQMLKFANSFDWDNGKSNWNIFQRNDYYIHVFSPVISYNDSYDACEHVTLHAINKSDFHSDDVYLYVKVQDMVRNSKCNKIDVRKTWSINITCKWFKKEFIPLFCKKNNYLEDIIQIEEDREYYEEDIFSRAQMFYMCNKAEVGNEELNKLKEALIFCLNKKSAYSDMGYIKSKLGIQQNLTTNDDIIEYLNSNEFNKYLMKPNYNSSIADDLLRCIKSFTDNYSNHRINDYDIKYLSKKINSLISKMEKIELLGKYDK
ncbi:toll/interleukin-1 receptor domain-containing protein [Clostridium estertheticum]|uniref:Toll/interleukin-1 receptor domain-containing protein n=1 Tax=Clostridium estertheticum TaxID=238834 RepID=A0AA47I648_9CLOT|nr:toll/interleukin-1 receptor domain-containing protein [Clostridium estertheticum]MBU3157791.1 toll/interleukin-1 receptor domain-containing protein [Clostridium estertheticum]WAG59435.1 toll/interleukin-1 receptor domain-containing protein [Clostridium estertheticum]